MGTATTSSGAQTASVNSRFPVFLNCVAMKSVLPAFTARNSSSSSLLSTPRHVDCSKLGVHVLLQLVHPQTKRHPPLKAEEDKPMMATRKDIESARLSMLEARKALEDYETLKGVASSSEHTILSRVFAKAAQAYLKLSTTQR